MAYYFFLPEISDAKVRHHHNSDNPQMLVFFLPEVVSDRKTVAGRGLVSGSRDLQVEGG